MYLVSRIEEPSRTKLVLDAAQLGAPSPSSDLLGRMLYLVSVLFVIGLTCYYNWKHYGNEDVHQEK